ncbi:helix-turn-helix domain-containing protein [Streptomyces sp. NBC_00069]|uniref:helix-turn-helix domain-containing protein n=1 Tax=Streptomyces sp. NBC_00069 TaxID=2975639 RepID=UPI0032498FD0
MTTTHEDHTGPNLLRLRTGRGWSTHALSSQLAGIDYELSASSISRTERGTRGATAADVLALAVVFDVSPSALLLPLEDDPHALVDLPGRSVPAAVAWAWAAGERPLTPMEEVTRSEMWRYQTESQPVFRREIPPVSKRNTPPGKGA